jgi:sulfoxide reductase heme-binding subunit YedZ
MNENVPSLAWYVSRSTALVGFFLLYLSIFLGAIGRIPIFRKWAAKMCALNAHCWLSVQALVFALVHGVALTFDRYLDFSWQDIFLPFHSRFETLFLALGTVAFYLMILLIASSYARRRIPTKAWRLIHALNLALYGFSVIHALTLGSDLQSGILRDIFVFANAALVLLLAANLFYRMKNWKEQPQVAEKCNADLPRHQLPGEIQRHKRIM